MNKVVAETGVEPRKNAERVHEKNVIKVLKSYGFELVCGGGSKVGTWTPDARTQHCFDIVFEVDEHGH